MIKNKLLYFLFIFYFISFSYASNLKCKSNEIQQIYNGFIYCAPNNLHQCARVACAENHVCAIVKSRPVCIPISCHRPTPPTSTAIVTTIATTASTIATTGRPPPPPPVTTIGTSSVSSTTGRTSTTLTTGGHTITTLASTTHTTTGAASILTATTTATTTASHTSTGATTATTSPRPSTTMSTTTTKPLISSTGISTLPGTTIATTTSSTTDDNTSPDSFTDLLVTFFEDENRNGRYDPTEPNLDLDCDIANEDGKILFKLTPVKDGETAVASLFGLLEVNRDYCMKCKIPQGMRFTRMGLGQFGNVFPSNGEFCFTVSKAQSIKYYGGLVRTSS